MELKETAISSETVYDGKIIKVQKDRVRLPNGKEALREVVRHQGGVCVCAVDGDPKPVFVRQYRYPFQEAMLELPAGSSTWKGRMLMMEAARAKGGNGDHRGGHDAAWRNLFSVGFCDESIICISRSISNRENSASTKTRFINVEKIPLGRAVEMCLKGELKRCKNGGLRAQGIYYS